jgi:hypothetical protein
MKQIYCMLVLLLALCSVPAGAAEISFGVDISEYPELVLVPDYPVYYAPAVGANYFFYDGDFWMYQDDNWYQSPWYDGPWERVAAEDVPDILLQVPVRYYMQPPAYFFSWWYDDPPHWGEHWGHDWERHRHGWNKRDHRLHDKPAPLPDYQREYSGDRYPVLIEQQRELRHKNYRYRERDPLVLRHRQTQPIQSAPVLQTRERVPQAVGQLQHNVQRTNPLPQGNPEDRRISQRESVKEPGAAAASQQPQRTEAQPRSQQARPKAVRHEENVRGTEGAELRRSEPDTRQEQNRSEEKERGRER